MDHFEAYRSEIQKALARGDATEHTHRPALKKLIEGLFPGRTATNEPTRVACGAPDYAVSETRRGLDLSIGHIEAKDIGKSLDEAEKSEQLKRYRDHLSNLVLTDYLEFRWYVDGEKRLTARLASHRASGKLALEPDGPEKVVQLLQAFVDHGPVKVGRAKELAVRMARLTRMVRDIIIKAFEKEYASEMLIDLRKAFAQTLIPDLDQPEKTAEFADMYAQTIAYGLFAARCNHKSTQGAFIRLGAAAEIPKTNPFLRNVFEIVTGTALDEEPYAGFVDSLVTLLDQADLEAILEDFGRRTKQKDPVVHFYETFLFAYDPKIREMRGVYYTPEPVVSYIVRSVDYLLKTRFGCPDGLADRQEVEYQASDKKGQTVKNTSPKVLILDPACGTGSFLYAVVDIIRERFKDQGDAGMWPGYVKKYILPRLFGFELLMAPYAVAHFNLGMQLAGHDLKELFRKQWVYDFEAKERLNIFLTNTLERVPPEVQPNLYGYWKVITEESKAADGVKRDLPILVVMGNPPYSGHSANRSWEIKELEKGKKKKVRTFIGELLQDYYQVDGQPLGERNPKWLQDDYVKFIRWGQWRIEETGAGILALITNHGYLDNPTFRGMRQQLMNAFTDIYILDLHGSSKKKEKTPDGGKDENVFDIQQGVAIGIFVKAPDKQGPARVHHADLWGEREGKYQALAETDVNSAAWRELKPAKPIYLFLTQDTERLEEYEQGWKVNDVFPVNSVGVVTGQDKKTIAFSRDEAVALSERKGLQSDTITRLVYRPFDVRYVVYDKRVVTRPRAKVMRHMQVGQNIALVSARSNRSPDPDHFYCNRFIMETKCGESTTQSTLFPLYTYPSGREKASSFPSGPNGRVPNFDPGFVADLEKRLKLKFVSDGRGDLKKAFGPEDIFEYIYAVFHAPTYRSRYAEFLKIDFPRVPLTTDLDLFKELCALGRDLVSLHLLESYSLEERVTNYPVPGDNEVAKGHPKHLAPGQKDPLTGQKLNQGRVYINKSQYFEGVPPEVWDFHIGGYQVAHKWLKDRQGRKLSYDDLEHYQKTIKALAETIRLMAEIDAVIDKCGGWPLAGSAVESAASK